MNKYYNKNNIALFLLLPLSFLSIELIFTLFTKGNIVTIQSVLFTLSFAIFFNSFNLLFKKKKTIIIYSVIIISIMSVLAISQVMYFNYFADFYSFTSVTNLRELFVVKGEMKNAIDISLLAFILVPIISAIIYKYTLETSFKSYKYFIVSLLVFVLSFNLTKLTFADNHDNSDPFLTKTYLYDNLYNKGSAVETFGLLSYSYRDLVNIVKNTLNIENEQNLETIDTYFNEHPRQAQDNSKSGMFEGKNVVLILAESLNSWGIDELTTPTLYKMASEGMYFENYMAPRFQSSTADAEFAINTGLCPSIDFGATAYTFNKNYFPTSLATMFKAKGYSANSYHNSQGNFYNRYAYHNAFGYDKFYAAEQLGIKLPEKFGYDWPKDYDLFEKSTDIILDNYVGEQPFLSYLITVSAHVPYDGNRKSLDEELKIVNETYDVDSKIAYYLAATMDLDNGVTHMLNEFESAGILEDTVFILVADHYSYGMDEKTIWEYYDKYENDKLMLNNIPFLIWTPGIQQEVITEKCSQFDVHPTISNLFNLDNDLTYSMGNDIFSDEENTIIYGSRNTWEDSKILYDKNKIAKQFIDNVSDDYAIEKNRELVKKINIFQYVLNDNYFNSQNYKDTLK